MILSRIDNNIKGITALSVEEYEKYWNKISPVEESWWLCSPGCSADRVACVFGESGDVYVYGFFVYREFGVRPALQISNPESMNLESGDVFSFGGQTFTYLGEGLALCDDIIGKCVFQEAYKAPDANDYEKSDVKAYMEKWLEKQLFLEQNGEKARLDSHRTALVDAAYEMYKAKWMAEHISVDRQIELMRNALSDFIEDAPGYSFAEYLDNILFDNGYNSEYYASKDEFLNEEFQDIDYMHGLLQDDSLIGLYDEIIRKEIEENESLFVEER